MLDSEMHKFSTSIWLAQVTRDDMQVSRRLLLGETHALQSCSVGFCTDVYRFWYTRNKHIHVISAYL